MSNFATTNAGMVAELILKNQSLRAANEKLADEKCELRRDLDRAEAVMKKMNAEIEFWKRDSEHTAGELIVVIAENRWLKRIRRVATAGAN